MAAPIDTRYSLILNNAAFWDEPNPDYLTLTNVVSGAATSDHRTTSATILNLAARSPVAVAFTIAADSDRIYIGHTPTVFPADLAYPTVFDNHFLVLVGDNDDAVTSVAIPTAGFTRTTADVRCADMDGIIGANGFTHPTAVVLRQGPHAATAADTDMIRARPVALLPSDLAGSAVENADAGGSYSLPSFYARFLEAPLTAGGDAAARVAPLVEWFRVTCTQAGAAGAVTPVLSVAPMTSGIPGTLARLNLWTNRIRGASMAKLGAGGPGLTSAAFQAGITTMTTTLERNKDDTLAFHRAERDVSFADKHGDALSDRVFRFCLVTADVDLPEVHRLLVKSSKSREYGVVGALLAERANSSVLPIHSSSAPIATTRLVDDLFRTYMPGGTGLDFGKGLSPFAVVCLGHHDAAGVQKLVKGASLVEGGTSVSLDDTNKLISSDIRFPTEVYVATEKLYGWSVVIDVYHGINHPIAVSVRRAVGEICPLLFRLVTSMAEDLKTGMDMVCRVMYELQQDYFGYLRDVGLAVNPLTVPVPAFTNVREHTRSFRVSSLSDLPISWYSMATAPTNPRFNSRARAATNPRETVVTVPTVNAHADQRLLERFRACPFSSISSMIEGHTVDVPKHSGDPVCLTWALKGQCSNSCKRKHQHVRYPRGVNQKLNELLDACGVVNSQP